MPSVDREDSHDRELVLRHQHSGSDGFRGSIPMWDSSDPERAPPPLPLNPGSPATRPNASANIQAAAAALAEKSRENAPSSYTVNPMPLKGSPEKSLIKGQYHKRLQSTHNLSPRELPSFLDNRSPERVGRPLAIESGSRSRDKTPPRENTPTPNGRESRQDSPNNARISSRYLSKPLLGENTPPSATMLALQNMQIPNEDPSPPLSNITNSAGPPRPPQLDALSSQILGLTNIATGLQREMAQLSRRSKDNATDLVSLKAATTSRDEDIRKSLQELVSNLSSKFLDPEITSRFAPNAHSGTGGYSLDSKAHDSSSPSSRKNFTLPRIPSPSSFAAAIERDITASPGAISTDGSASIALLEKVLREMATKEGQDKLLELMDEIKSRPSEKDTDNPMAKMLEEILNLVKENSGSRALVRSRNVDFEHESPRSGHLSTPRSDWNSTPDGSRSKQMASDVSTGPHMEEIMAMLKRIKGSVADGGGLTNEVKAIVRELRGEVLGMGREIARQLEQGDMSRAITADGPKGLGKEEIAEIVESNLAELRGHMDHLIREKTHQQPPTELARPAFDSQEMYFAVKNALAESPLLQQAALEGPRSNLEKEEILETVREAWETYKPEIELQNFGLERDEILDCLTEGLKDYKPANETRELPEPSITHEQIIAAVKTGLEGFNFPRLESDNGISKDEIILTIRDCMEGFEWPDPPAPEKEPEITRDEVLSAVKEGLAGQDALTREIEFDKDHLFEAVRAGIDQASGRIDGNVGSEVLERLHDLVDGMKTEFQQYSAASGRDTEQVLDAVKDGLEVLRSEIETYVDRAADVTGKDEILDTVKDGFRLLQSDLEKAIAESAADSAVARGVPDTPELLDAMEKEFEHLRQSLSNLLIRDGVSNDKDEILDAIRDITESDRSMGDSSDVVKLVKEEFEHLRETLSMTMVKPNSTVETEEIIAALKESFDALQEESLGKREGSNESVVSSTGELLDAFNDGVDAIRGDLEKVLNKPSDEGVSYEILDTLKEGLVSVKSDIERLHESQRDSDANSNQGKEVTLANEGGISQDIESLKVLITQLQIKVEAIDMNPAPSEPAGDYLKKEDLDEVLAAVKDMQGSVTESGTREFSANATTATKDDTEAIETLLRNTKAKIDEFTFPEPEDMAKTEHIESLEALIKESKESLDALGSQIDTSELSTKADIGTLETLLKDIWVTVEGLQNKQGEEEGSRGLEDEDEEKEEGTEKVVKSDIHTLEAMIFEIKTQIEELDLPDVETLPTKVDIGGLSELVTGFQEKIEAENELTAQAFESRKIEHGGLAEKIEEAKGVVEEIRDELKAKLEGSGEGIAELQKTIDALNESSGSFATADSLKELSELINREFERSHGELEGNKVDSEERDAAALVKQEEARAAIIHELGARIDEKFGDIIAKYDDTQAAADSKFTAIEERDTQSLDAVMSTKSIAEDLKLVIGGMGNSVTETCEQMSIDAKTFFQRVDESYTKMEDIHAGVKAQHEQTKEDLEKTIAGTGRVETKIDEFHPQLLSQIKDILSVVGQHFEHSRQSIDEIKTGVSSIPAAIPPLLPALPPPPSPRAEPVVEKYDDSQVHDKLNELLTHASDAGKSFSRMDKLDEIHQQVLATSREVSEMVATQSRLTQEDHESRKQEAQETALAVERNLAQKERVEAEIVDLNEEKDALRHDVHDLKQEKETLSKQNTKLAKDLSALETALKIRREEMQLMEDRAEGLERRIVEGALDHARSLLVTRPSTTKDMNLKRVPSSSSTVTRGSAATAKEGSSLSNTVGMALKRRTPARSNGGSTVSNAGKERRILSLSNMTGNKGPDRPLALAPSNSSGLGNLKRSHSVKSSYPARKHSWGSRSSLANKENEVFNEEDEDHSGDDSDAGTERRSSYTGTFTDSMSYVTGSRLSTDQQSSYAGNDSILEESEHESDEYAEGSGDESQEDTTVALIGSRENAEPGHDELEPLEPPPKLTAGELVMYGHHSDSGLGTDVRSDLSEKVE